MTPLDNLKVWGHFRPCGEDRSRCVEGDRWIFPGLFAATKTRYFSRSGRAICSCVFGDRTRRIEGTPRDFSIRVCGDRIQIFTGVVGPSPAVFAVTKLGVLMETLEYFQPCL